MWLPILLSCLAFVASKQTGPRCNTCIKVGDYCHNVSYLFEFDAPFRQSVVITQLGILRSKNILYFAFEPNITDPEYYKVGFISLDAPEMKGLLEGQKPVTNFRTFAIDQDKEVIYLGGGDAIYSTDLSHKAAFLSSGGDTILSIYFKKHVFFVRDGEYKIVEKEDELFRPYEQYRNIKKFVIDRNNVLVFVNTSGLFAGKFNSNDTVFLHKNPFFRGLTIDLDGVVYAWWIDGIYRVAIEADLEDSYVIKVADATKIGAVTFDNDNNLLFSSEKRLYRLTETNTTLC